MGFSLGKALGGLVGGSLLGPFGALAGGLLGGFGLGGSLEDFLMGTEGGLETKVLPRWNPEQQQLFNILFRKVKSGIKGPLKPTKDEEGYIQFLRNFENWVSDLYSPDVAMQKWEQYVMPSIESQYAGPGYYGSARTEAVRKSATDVFLESETGRREALLSSLPQVKSALAEYTRRFKDPLANPYLAYAFQMLGYDPYYVIGGTVQPQPGALQSLIGGLGSGLGAGLGALIA